MFVCVCVCVFVCVCVCSLYVTVWCLRSVYNLSGVETKGKQKGKLRLTWDEARRDPYKKLLLRGIGVHHTTASNVDRTAVEVLFREKKLGLVIATDTLAQGIDMPCRSVVFAGDDSHLSATNFLQMKGRAGRRGHDLRGNVVFLGIKYTKLRRLTTCSLPPLVSNAPLSTMTVLRLAEAFQSVETTAAAARIRDAEVSSTQAMIARGLNRMIHATFASGVNSLVPLQLAQHVRFSMEFLRRLEFVGGGGVVRKSGSLAAHAYYEETGSIMLTELIRRGALNNGGRRRLMEMQAASVLALLFQRVPMLARYTRVTDAAPASASDAYFTRGIPRDGGCGEGRLAPGVATSADDVARAVPALGPVLRSVNGHAMVLLKQHLRAVLALVPSSAPRCVWPLSAAPVHGGGGGEAAAAGDGLVGDLARRAMPFKLRSPALAIAGEGDAWSCIVRLSQELCSALFLDPAQVPIMDDDPWLLNRYLVDIIRVRTSILKVSGRQRMIGELGFDDESIYQALSDAVKVFNSVLARLAVYDEARTTDPKLRVYRLLAKDGRGVEAGETKEAGSVRGSEITEEEEEGGVEEEVDEVEEEADEGGKELFTCAHSIGYPALVLGAKSHTYKKYCVK